jgi:hypothetical protein
MKRRRPASRNRAEPPARPVGETTRDWVLGRGQAPFIVQKPAPYRPELRLMLDAGADRIIAMEPVEPGGSASDVAGWAAGKVRPGIRLRVEEHAVAEALRQRLGGEVEVLEAPTPEIDWALEALEEYGAGAGSGHEPQWADGAAPEAKAGFYVAAMRFERAAPWKKAGDGQVLVVDVPAMGWKGACISIIGQAEDTFGLLLFRSLADFLQFVRLGDKVAAGSRRTAGPGVPLFSINFDRPRDLPGGKKLAKEARAHGFFTGPQGRVPYILKLSPDAVESSATTDDYRLATACLVAVDRFVERHEELFAGKPLQPTEERSSVPTAGGDLEVVVSCPPSDLPWHWGEEEPADGLRRRDCEEVAAAFHAARLAEGARPEEADADRWAAQEMMEFKAAYGESYCDWTPDDVTDFMMVHYPSHGTETGAELRALPSRIDAFLGWLAANGRGHAGPLEAARRRVAECRDQFLEEASDPRRFGLAKTFGQAMSAANVDPDDRAAVNAFTMAFNRRLRDDPWLLPSLGGDMPRKTWVWNGVDPPPDPRAPCPCGSGRRYRKCCMPR